MLIVFVSTTDVASNVVTVHTDWSGDEPPLSFATMTATAAEDASTAHHSEPRPLSYPYEQAYAVPLYAPDDLVRPVPSEDVPWAFTLTRRGTRPRPCVKVIVPAPDVVPDERYGLSTTALSPAGVTNFTLSVQAIASAVLALV